MKIVMKVDVRMWFILAVAVSSGCQKPAVTDSKPPVQYFQVDRATAAKVSGVIRFEGKAPASKRITMDSDEDCRKLHQSPVFEQKFVIGKNRGLANVFVYVKEGLEGKAFPPAPQAVVMEQRGCQFIPRIVALRTGQTLTVKNADPVSHNIHPLPKNNRDWNHQQPPQAADLQRKFARPEVMIPVKCNIHSWMRSYIGVLDHPFFAVTGPDGTFAIEGLPPGQYVVAAWHEAFGEKTLSLSVGDAQAGVANFVFGAGPKT